jgi:hypothetical protein
VHKTDRILHGIVLMVAIGGSIALCLQGYRLLQIDAVDAAAFWRKPNVYSLAAELKRTVPRKNDGGLRWAKARGIWRDDGKRCAMAH